MISPIVKLLKTYHSKYRLQFLCSGKQGPLVPILVWESQGPIWVIQICSVEHFTHALGILVPSYALLLPFPIVWLSSLTMHCGHFIPPTSPPHNTAPLWHSLCILLFSLHLAYLCFSVSAIPVQRSDRSLEHVNCYLPGAVLPKIC